MAETLRQVYEIKFQVRGDSELRKAQQLVEKFDRETKRAATSVGTLNKKTADVGKGMRAGRQAIANTSYQLQDFIVQVTGGQSAMLAFAQQAPQLLGSFGAIGAVIGVVAALTPAVIAGFRALLGTTEDLADAGKTLSKSFEDWASTTGTATSSVDELEKKFGSFAKEVRETAKALQELQRGELLKETAEVFSAISDTNAFKEQLAVQYEIAKAAGESTTAIQQLGYTIQRLDDVEGFDNIAKTVTALVDGIKQTFGPLDELSERQRNLVKPILEALSDLQKKTAEVATEEERASDAYKENAKSVRELIRNYKDYADSLREVKRNTIAVTEIDVQRDAIQKLAWVYQDLADSMLAVKQNRLSFDDIKVPLNDEDWRRLQDYQAYTDSLLAGGRQNLGVEIDEFTGQRLEEVAEKMHKVSRAAKEEVPEALRELRRALADSYTDQEKAAQEIERLTEAFEKFQDQLTPEQISQFPTLMEKLAKETLPDVKKEMDLITATLDSLRTESEESADKADELADALSKVGDSISAEDIAKIKEHIEKLRDPLTELEKGIVNTFTTSISNAFDSLIDRTKSVSEAFSDMIVSILQDIAKMLVSAQIQRFISLLGNSVFSGTSFSGGFTGTPTPTPILPSGFSTGSASLLRASPVVASGATTAAITSAPSAQRSPIPMSASRGSGVTVNVINNSSSQVRAEENRSTGDIDVYIEGRVRSMLGQGKFDTVMRSSYGVRRRGG